MSAQGDGRNSFFTPERFAREQGERMVSARGRLLIAGCRSGTYLSEAVASRYDALLSDSESSDHVLHVADVDYQFADTETCVRIEQHVGGYDVYLFQAIYDPCSERTVDQNYLTFLIAARTLREHGARHVTGVLPYLAYGRQDKPTKFRREPTTAKLMADLSLQAGIDRLIAWDPHTGQLRGFYAPAPTNMLESLMLFLDEFEELHGRDDAIVVSPDVGGSKFVSHYARAADLRFAVASKLRPEPGKAEITDIVGDFGSKTKAIILDDMIASGGTMYGVIRRLIEERGIEEVYIGVSHNLCAPKALARLRELHAEYCLKRLVVTDSIPQTPPFRELPFMKVHSLADALARTINRIHYNRSVSEVFYRP